MAFDSERRGSPQELSGLFCYPFVPLSSYYTPVAAKYSQYYRLKGGHFDWNNPVLDRYQDPVHGGQRLRSGLFHLSSFNSLSQN